MSTGPSVSRDELLERRLQDAADELCDGRAAPLVLALVQGGRFSPEELARLRRMIDEAAGISTVPQTENKPNRGTESRGPLSTGSGYGVRPPNPRTTAHSDVPGTECPIEIEPERADKFR